MDSNATPSPAPAQNSANDIVPPTSWINRNLSTIIITVVVMGFAIFFLRRSDDPRESIISATKVAVALGLVIFIHELGHFAAAKLCDVHVQTFSIGFGGPLFGICSAKWGETTYKIAWVPLGGYVKMVGEGEETEEGNEDPRSYKNKKVWQRMIIISAGVVMNLLLAWVGYMFVYLTHGFDQNPGIIGTVVPGGPGWKKGLRPGDHIRKIGEKEDPYYDELKRVVMRAGKNKLDLVYESYPDGKAKRIESEITPARSSEILAPMLLIQSSQTTKFVPKARGAEGPYLHLTPASKAEPALQFGDLVIGASDSNDPNRITPIRKDPRHPETDLLDYFDLNRRMQILAGKDLTLQVRRAADGSIVNVKVKPAYARLLGLRMRMGQIVCLRDDSPAASAGFQVQDGKSKGDVIHAVEITEKSGNKLKYSAAPKEAEGELPLDPMRLPMQLALWAASRPSDSTVKFTVLRAEGHQDVEKIISVKWDLDWELYDSATTRIPETPLSLAGIGLAYQVSTTIAAIEKGSPAGETSLQNGDEITAFEVKRELKPGKTETDKKDVKEEQWAGFVDMMYGDERVQEVTLFVKNKPNVTLTTRDDLQWPMVERGFIFEQEKRLEKADGFLHAAELSGKRVLITIATIYENLMGMIKGRISVRGISGPMTIAAFAFEKAGRDTIEFILFIALININLAVVNFLPIPVLDGGHMVFLTYELFRGKPPSERWRLILTIIGLVIVLGLMALGLVLDINRWIVEPLMQFLGW